MRELDERKRGLTLMFSFFKYHAPQRALIVSRDPALRQDIAVVLSTYGFTHDAAETRREGMEKFLIYKHAVVISDVDLLPKFPRHMDWLYRYAHRNPLTLITVTADKIAQAYPYLEKAAYGLLHLPLDADDFTVTFERALEFNALRANNMFLRDAFFLFALSLPLLALLVFLVTRSP
jgi:DNA-binding NtrC family response regulator